MTIRRSAISHDHLLRVGAVERGQRRDGRRPSDRLDNPPAGHIGQRGAGRVAQLRQPRADPIRAGCQVFAERDRIPHARSDIGVAVLQPLQHGQRQIPVRRRQPRSQPLRQRGPDREDTDAARAGHPLARGRVDRIGAHHTVDVAE